VAVDREARALERLQLGFRESCGPGDDEIRMQRQDALEIEAMAVADTRDHARGLRFHGKIRRPDDARAAAGGKQHGGRAGREADHALRRTGKGNHPRFVVTGLPGRGAAAGQQCQRSEYQPCAPPGRARAPP